ncbi:MAG: trypsin-like serine peptidase [Hyalangium sp.]|uniref:trypsin-like serine peptidase n=1 Tax=Hyalangium sp. TaxID=2028555 RepID=UPI00389B39D6
MVIPPLRQPAAPWEKPAPRPEEQLLQAGTRGLRKLEQEGDAANLSDVELLGLEAVVLLVVRPALFVTGGDFVSPPAPWGALLDQQRASIRRIAPSVGRIEVSFGFGESQMIGTGFLVAPDVVMTNRHVVKNFSELDQGTWRFMGGMTPAIDYRAERGSTARASFQLVEILAVHDSLDLALVRVSSEATHGHPAPGPLSLTSMPSESLVGRNVYVIGYPASDNQGLTPPQVLRDIFGSVYQVKRLQPGKVLEVEAGQPIFTHDCSTLGGNSGSCVVDLETGRVIGLHFRGHYRHANYAVALWQLADDPMLKSAGVRFD